MSTYPAIARWSVVSWMLLFAACSGDDSGGDDSGSGGATGSGTTGSGTTGSGPSGSNSTTGSGPGSGGTSSGATTAANNVGGSGGSQASGGSSVGGSSAETGGAGGSGGSGGSGGTDLGGAAGEAGEGNDGGSGGSTSTSDGATSTTGSAGAGGAPDSDCEAIPSRAFGDAEDFSVTSSDFDYCDPMPEETTCDGKLFPESVSPEISWTEGPAGTLSYAISFTDITILSTSDPSDDVVYNRGYHYVIWDIPADVLTLPAELGSGYEVPEIDGALQWAPFNDYGYMGPCPNFPGATLPLNDDAYSFTVYAMPLETLPIPAVEPGGPSFPRTMDDYLRDTALAAAEYRGTSNAQANSITGVFPPTFDLPCPSEGDQPEDCLSAE